MDKLVVYGGSGIPKDITGRGEFERDAATSLKASEDLTLYPINLCSLSVFLGLTPDDLSAHEQTLLHCPVPGDEWTQKSWTCGIYGLLEQQEQRRKTDM